MRKELKTGEFGHKAGSPLFLSASASQSSKLQIPEKFQTSNRNFWRMGIWNFFGIWSLEPGVFLLSHA
jgi:hypothetical protein